jgi:hypothetical protein
MRRLWTRKSRSRLFLVVAAVSVITLAAASPIYSAARKRHVPAVDRMVSLECSARAADELVKRLGLSDPEVANPVFKLLCGAFTGPGSQTMVASLSGPGNTGMIDWVVFRSLGGEWQLLMKRHQAAVLTAAGSDIREKVWIFRPGDSRCCPSGGTRARIWHWDGTRLVAGPWKQVTPPKSGGATLHLREFVSPSRNIFCSLGDEGRAYCLTVKPPRSVDLSPNGHISVCRGTRCIGTGRFGSSPTLGYGKKDAFAGYICRSKKVGVTCTVATSGKGFLINRSGVSRVGR